MDNIIGFATEKLIQRSDVLPDDYSNGSVILPFSYHIVQLLLLRKNDIESHYNIKYLSTPEDMSYNLLWKCTTTIDNYTMNHHFQKELHQEEVYCKISMSQLSQGTVIPGLDRERVLSYIKTIPSLQSVRFICLKLQK